MKANEKLKEIIEEEISKNKFLIVDEKTVILNTMDITARLIDYLIFEKDGNRPLEEKVKLAEMLAKAIGDRGEKSIRQILNMNKDEFNRFIKQTIEKISGDRYIALIKAYRQTAKMKIKEAWETAIKFMQYDDIEFLDTDRGIMALIVGKDKMMLVYELKEGMVYEIEDLKEEEVRQSDEVSDKD